MAEDLKTPNFYSIFETKHYIYGRVRYSIPLLKENEEFFSLLEDNLKNFSFVTKYHISPITGTLLIHFNESEIDIEMISAIIIKILNLDVDIEKKKIGTLSRVINEGYKILNNAIHTKSYGILDAKSILSFLLIGIGTRKFISNPILPNGMNLVWWGFSSIYGGEHDK